MDLDDLLGMAESNARHRWTRDDDIVIVGMYLLTGTSNQPKAVKEHLAELIGCPVTSVPMRFANVDALLGDGKLTSAARMTKEVCDELAPLPVPEVKKRVEAAYERLGTRASQSARGVVSASAPRPRVDRSARSGLPELLDQLDRLRPVLHDEIERFGDWLRSSRGIEERPISDYKSRVRRALTDGSESEDWTSGVQANMKTAIRAFIEFRRGQPGS
ncbi:MAG: hypothetical protein ACRDRT_13725 [Pseudonocardiaceae bacterium]